MTTRIATGSARVDRPIELPPPASHDASVVGSDPVENSRMDGYRHLPPLISVQEAAAILGVSRSSAYRAVERGELPVVRLAGRLHVPVARLLVLIGLVEPPPTSPLPWLRSPVERAR